jgi:prepilin-type N-terminal cleavage/methylation domain-containing protein
MITMGVQQEADQFLTVQFVTPGRRTMIQHTEQNRRGYRQKRRGTLGFTLIEVIVAIAVLSVAVGVFVRLFGGSVDLAQIAQQRTIATGLADEQLSAILRHPDRFLWEEDDAGNISIRLTGEDPKPGNPFDSLRVKLEDLPPLKPVANQQAALYKKFRWQAFAKQPTDKNEVRLPYYEVTVVIRWEDNQKSQALALTSSVPHGDVPLQKEVKI